MSDTTCHLCRRPIYVGEARAEYDGTGEDFIADSLLSHDHGAPILAIHWACGEDDSADRDDEAR